MLRAIRVALGSMILFLLCIFGLSGTPDTPSPSAVRAQGNGTRGTIIIAVAANAPPFAAQADNGQIVGFDRDVMQTLVRTAGLRATYEAVPFVELIPGVATRLYDAAVGCIAVNDARRTLVDFTAGYFTTGAVLVYSQADTPLYDLSDLTEDMVVGTLVGSVTEALLDEQGVAEVSTFGSEQAVLDALVSGVVDAALVDEITATRFMRTNPEAPLHVASGLLTTNQCGIAVSKENPRLLLELNAALTRMKNNGRYLSIYRRWFGSRPLSGPRPAARPTMPIATSQGDVATVTPIVTTALDPLVESILGLYAVTLATEPATYQLLELASDGVWLESMVVPEADTLRGVQTLNSGVVQIQRGNWQSTRTDPIAMTVQVSATVRLSPTVASSAVESPSDANEQEELSDSSSVSSDTAESAVRGDGNVNREEAGEEGTGEEIAGTAQAADATEVDETEVDETNAADNGDVTDTPQPLQPYRQYLLTIEDDGSLLGAYTLYTTAVPTPTLVLTETVQFVGQRVLQ